MYVIILNENRYIIIITFSKSYELRGVFIYTGGIVNKLVATYETSAFYRRN